MSDLSTLSKVFHHYSVRRILVTLFFVLIGISLLVILGKYVGKSVPKVETWVANQGPWAPIAYLIVFCILGSCFFSVSVLSFSAGALFGLRWGFLYAYTASFLCSICIFYLTRLLAHEHVKNYINQHEKFAKIERAVSQGKEGKKVMFLLRLSPLPFAPLSYVLSAAGISLRSYILACSAMFLSIFISVYYGYVANHVTKLAGDAEHRSPSHYIIMFTMLLITITTVAIVSHQVRKALKRAGAA